jgi:hypothetical protein
VRGNIKSFEKSFTHAEVVALAERTLKRFGGDRNKAGRYARSMENRYESSKWAQVVEVLATSGRHHATKKKSPTQLDREVAEALATKPITDDFRDIDPWEYDHMESLYDFKRALQSSSLRDDEGYFLFTDGAVVGRRPVYPSTARHSEWSPPPWASYAIWAPTKPRRR